MIRHAVALALSAAALAGCCCRKVREVDTRPLMEPLPAGQRIAAMNQRAALVETVRARGKVTIVWIDKAGKRQEQAADGLLIFGKKRLAPQAGTGAPVYYETVLFGQVAGQDVFELGENATNYWMAFRVDPKTADVAGKSGPLDIANPADPGAKVIPLRAGTVPLLLGVAPVQSVTGAVPPVVLTNPLDVQVITVEAAGGGGAIRPVSAVQIDRREPGDIAAVRLYWPDGLIEGEAHLSGYQDVQTYKPGGEPGEAPEPGPTIRLPFHIEVNYPSRKAAITLEVSRYEVNVTLPPAAFKLPDFEKQGLKVTALPGAE